MKKILFLVISIIISGNIGAQKLDWQERRKAADEIDVLIQNYINFCELSELGQSEYSTDQVEAFKALFADGAKITDPVTSQIAEDGNTVVVEQSVEDYIQALMERFPNGMTIKVAKLQGDYAKLDDYNARIAMERQLRAKDENNRRITDTSHVMLHLVINEDLDEVKITKFVIEVSDEKRPIAVADEMALNLKRGEKKTSKDLSKNDKNIDKSCVYRITRQAQRGTVVLDKQGYATYTPKSVKTNIESDEFEYEVCKNSDCSRASVNVKITRVDDDERRDYKGLHINPHIAFGVSTNNNSNIIWGYETLPGTSIRENIQSAGGTAIGAGLELDYYFSDYIGIGTGVQYNRVSGGFEVDSFQVKYAFVDIRNHERTLTVADLTEDYTINNIGVPLLLKFRTYPERKLGIFAHAGILFNLSSSAKSNLSNGLIDYEAIRYSTDGGEAGDSYGSPILENVDDEAFSLNQTTESYGKHTTSDATITQHFNGLCSQGFQVGSNLTPASPDNSTDIGSHFSLLGRVGILYNFSESAAFQIGLQYISGTLNADESYEITGDITCANGTTNAHVDYNTLLQGGTRYSTFGLNVGLSMRFGNKRNRL